MQLLQMLLMLIKRCTFSTTTFYISKQRSLLLHGVSHDAILSSLMELVASFFTEVCYYLVVTWVVDRILTPRIVTDSRAFYI